MIFLTYVFGLLLSTLLFSTGYTQPVEKISIAGQSVQLEIREAGDQGIRVTIKPIGFGNEFPFTPALVDMEYPKPIISLQEISGIINEKVGNLNVEVSANPLTLLIRNAAGELIQELVFKENGNISFKLDDQPVLGMGEGGPKPGRDVDWRELPIEFDRQGRFHGMQPRWQSDAYGSRNPVAFLIGTSGWGIFIATPWVQVDMQNIHEGVFIPWKPSDKSGMPQTQRNQQQNLGKGLPPRDGVIPGLYDLFVFDTHDPAKLMKDISVISGPAVLPPKWALGYMQSHRTLEDENQIISIVDTFRKKQIPLDAVIYLGTGFCPQGWNTHQPSFDFNPKVFKRDPSVVLSELHDRNVKVVVHIVPWDRDKLSTLHGTIPPKPNEKIDDSHIYNYWQQHVGLINTGVDAFWPDEGDWFNLFERIKRHELYYTGPLSTTPNIRPWSLHRNGYLGIAQWGGWVWSGDTQSSWKTLEGQIAVGINYSLSISPFWGSDIGGFYPNAEKTGELYARWYQFGAFCPSFRSHGRTWYTALPWGFGLSDMGVREPNNRNDITVEGADKRSPLPSSMNNPTIEPITKKYTELRYQLMPYNYTLAWEARNEGMPFMRAMWLHYPDDEYARKLGDQYLWGRDMLIAPVFVKDATSRDVYLPEGGWYDWWTKEYQTGGKTITRNVDLKTMPIYVRAGAIIPFDPIRQYASEESDEPTSIKIFSGTNGQFTLYEDDGISLDYLQGKATWTGFIWNDEAKKLTISPNAPHGVINIEYNRTFNIELYPGGIIKTVKYTGQPIDVVF